MELRSDVTKHAGRHYLHGIERATGHAHEAYLHTDRESMHSTPSCFDDALIRYIESQKLVEVEGGGRTWTRSAIS